MITLGLAPTRKIVVGTTASALLLDTRSGYVHAAYEATTRADTLATSWGSSDAADERRQQSEREAFDPLIGELIASWPKLPTRHASPK